MAERITLKDWQVGHRDKSSSYKLNTINSEIKNSLSNLDGQITQVTARVDNLSTAASLNDQLQSVIITQLSGVYTSLFNSVNSAGDNILQWAPMDGIDGSSTNVTVFNDYGFAGLSYDTSISNSGLSSAIPTYTDEYGTTWPADNVTLIVDGKEISKNDPKRLIINNLVDSKTIWEVPDASPVRIKVETNRNSSVEANYIKFIPCPIYQQRILSIGYTSGGSDVELSGNFTPNGQVFLSFDKRLTDGAIYVDLIPVSANGKYYIGSELFDFGTVKYVDTGTITIPFDFGSAGAEIESILVYQGDQLVTNNISNKAIITINDGGNIIYNSSSSSYRWPFIKNFTGNNLSVTNSSVNVNIQLLNYNGSTFRLSGLDLIYKV